MPGWTFVAGAHVDGAGRGAVGAGLDLDGYRRRRPRWPTAGGVPILFPSAGLAGAARGRGGAAPTRRWPRRSTGCSAFELGRQFHPHGRIWTLDTYAAVLDDPRGRGGQALVAAPASRSGTGWRCATPRRPGFLVLTGNDLAIDMVRWGSDYLLGLSAFAPDAFARRDRLWAAGDARALEVDDALQALGAVAFRDPVPAYRHDAALVWRRRGWAPSAACHPASPTRPAGEADVLATLLDRLDATMAGARGDAVTRQARGDGRRPMRGHRGRRPGGVDVRTGTTGASPTSTRWPPRPGGC